MVSSEVLFRGSLLQLRRDQMLLPDGKTKALEIVVHPGAVAILPIDDQGRVWFVRQYRPATGESLLELPAGTLDPGESPEACAARECREEIGMAAGQLLPLGGFYLAPGYSTEYIHLFLAQELTSAPLLGDVDEEIELEVIPFGEIKDWIARGDLRDAKSLAALQLAADLGGLA
ncbi:MAG: NUDIX hydrolase [Anaerolineales bacterium]